ncbi:MAG: hypothetical protein JWP42_2763 [Pseudomonas sp.]|nr:hypothetical protein [Pseudomonas sp.]
MKKQYQFANKLLRHKQHSITADKDVCGEGACSRSTAQQLQTEWPALVKMVCWGCFVTQREQARSPQGCGLYGKVDAEGVHAVIAAHEHVAAMHQRNRLDDRQAQTVVVATVAARCVDPVEAFEQSGQMFAGNR